MRGLIAIIIGLLSANSFSSRTAFADQGISRDCKLACADKTSGSLGKIFKTKSAKKTRVGEVKHKRSKVKGLKTSPPFISGTSALSIYEFLRSEFNFIYDVNGSFLYCVKYKRGPPVSVS